MKLKRYPKKGFAFYLSRCKCTIDDVIIFFKKKLSELFSRMSHAFSATSSSSPSPSKELGELSLSNSAPNSSVSPSVSPPRVTRTASSTLFGAPLTPGVIKPQLRSSGLKNNTDHLVVRPTGCVRNLSLTCDVIDLFV